MGNIGIKISKPNKDITSTTLDDYTLWSKYKTMNIKARGTTTVSTTIGGSGEPVTGTTTVAHNFGYVPRFMAFTAPYVSQYLSKYVLSLLDYVNLDFWGIFVDAGGDIRESVTAYTTDTDIVFTADLAMLIPMGTPEGLAYTYTIDYILFMEEATPVPA